MGSPFEMDHDAGERSAGYAGKKAATRFQNSHHFKKCGFRFGKMLQHMCCHRHVETFIGEGQFRGVCLACRRLGVGSVQGGLGTRQHLVRYINRGERKWGVQDVRKGAGQGTCPHAAIQNVRWPIVPHGPSEK